jgi:hypothetical protein
MHLKGRLSIILVVLVVILLLDGEKFLIHEEDVFVPVLGMPLEETFQWHDGSPSKQELGGVPLTGGAVLCVDFR